MKAQVRGIYTTALTKMLLKNGFEIVNPSLAIKKRFKLSENSASPDIKIKDRYDLQGIRALGKREAIETLHSILHSNLEDVLTRKWRASVDGIYKGRVVESDNNVIYVDIGENIVGRLPESELTGEKSPLVQVERKRMGFKHPVLTTKLKIIGNYAILSQNSKVGVSLKIRNLNKRTELYTLGKKLAPQGWGIIWRESAANQLKEVLESEVKILNEKIKYLNKKASKAESPSLLVEGSYFIDVEFPCLSKKSLDKWRSTVAPTLDGHHFYKSCGGRVSAALEMAEKLIEKGEEKSKVEESLKNHIADEFPEEDSIVDVEHVKLSGMIFHLGQATIESINDLEVKYSRVIRSNGFYDGLNVEKEIGDKAVSQTIIGELWIKTEYFSRRGEWKGTYINLNTPLEVYPKTLRYVDLEIDVCIKPDGSTEILDVDKLEKAVQEKTITRRLFEKTKAKAKELEKTYKTKYQGF
jgi:Ribonuclease G/E